MLPASANLDSLKFVTDGGSCRVFAATHPEHGSVAVKIGSDNSAETISQFKREYSILRSLRHRGICRMWDFGWMSDHRPFIVMEWLGGKDLYEFTDSLPRSERFRMLTEFLSAVKYLHDLGIIHRDLKGENVLVDSAGKPTLTDLGLANAVGTGSGRSGTLEYMAPETIDGDPATVQSDVYAIGVILYRIAAGVLPFQADDPLHVVSLKKQPERIDFSAISESYPGQLVQLITRCIDPDPGARFTSVGKVLDQLTGAGLIAKSDRSKEGILDLLHHHLTAYNVSFVNEELSVAEGFTVVKDHRQAHASGLWPTLLDQIKMRGAPIHESCDNYVSFCVNGSGSKAEICIEGCGKTTDNQKTVEYEELSRNASDVILDQLFKGGITETGKNLLYRFSSGNMALMRILLEDLERSGFVVERSAGKALALPQVFDYQPPTEYLDAVAAMLPEVPENMHWSLELLSADPFDTRRDLLCEQKLLKQEDLRKLADLRILTGEDYHFSRSYIREYFYHRMPEDSRRRLHLVWSSVVADDGLLTARDRSERLFYHYVPVGDVVAAAEEALNLSDILRNQNEPERAREVVALAQSLAGIRENHGLCLRLLMRSADLAKAAGELDRALSEYASIVRLASRYREKTLLAEAYKDLGDLYKARYNYRRGIKALDRAVSLYSELGDELELSHCHNNMGNIHWIAGDLQKAEVDYLAALEIQRRLGVRRDTASTLSNLGGVRAVQFRLEESISLLRESIELFREIGELGEIARSTNNIAAVHMWNDELEKALEYLNESVQTNKSLRAEKELLYNYENIGEASYLLGDFEKARAALAAGLRLAPGSDHMHRGVYTTKLALVFMAKGDYRRAGTLLQLAARHRQQVTDLIFSVELGMAYGHYYSLLFDVKSAGAHLQESLEGVEKLGDTKKKANVLLLSGRLEVSDAILSGDMPDGYRQVLDLAREFPLRREMLRVQLELTDFYLKANDLTSAERSFECVEASDSFDGSHLFLPRANFLRGLLAHRKHSFDIAERSLTESVSGALSLHDYEQQWRSLSALGDVYVEFNRYEQALKCNMQAFDLLKVLANSIKSPEMRRTYLSDPAKMKIAETLEQLAALTT
jgi:serine/threonine protein kinase/tetratricopeptide (TPR) repeat protein